MSAQKFNYTHKPTPELLYGRDYVEKGVGVPPGVTLIILQNQWFKRMGADTDPRQIRRKAILDKALQWRPRGWSGGPEDNGDLGDSSREWHIKQYLFVGGLTGKRLRRIFPAKALDSKDVVFEETSTEYGWHSGFKASVDWTHLNNMIRKWRPSTIICLGSQARGVYEERGGMLKASLISACGGEQNVRWILGPHPADRRRDHVMADLKRVRDTWLGCKADSRMELE